MLLSCAQPIETSKMLPSRDTKGKHIFCPLWKGNSWLPTGPFCISLGKECHFIETCQMTVTSHLRKHVSESSTSGQRCSSGSFWCAEHGEKTPDSEVNTLLRILHVLHTLTSHLVRKGSPDCNPSTDVTPKDSYFSPHYNNQILCYSWQSCHTQVDV